VQVFVVETIARGHAHWHQPSTTTMLAMRTWTSTFTAAVVSAVATGTESRTSPPPRARGWSSRRLTRG
jgi:hypothetical protein